MNLKKKSEELSDVEEESEELSDVEEESEELHEKSSKKNVSQREMELENHTPVVSVERVSHVKEA